MADQRYKSIILLVLDGWGISPSWGGNAIAMNNPKIMTDLWRAYPHAILQAFKKVVGPGGKVGNSEIGHSSIGTGRIVFQDMTRIGQSIIDGSFLQNPELLNIVNQVRTNNSSLHIYGLLSDGGVHSHVDHLLALADFAKLQGITNTYFHCILDGRDAGALTALSFISQLENKLRTNGLGKIASLVGRFYALDRDNHWSRTAVAWKTMVEGVGERFDSAEQAISGMYRKGFDDEFMPPCIITDNGQIHRIQDNDAVLCFNFRADRARQMAKLFLGEQKLGMFFKPPTVYFAGMASYRLPSQTHTLFPPVTINDPLAKIISDHGLKQFHIAESEKYAHVTYFFNGGREEPFPGEERVFIPSPDVISYSQSPQMSAKQLTDELIKEMKTGQYQFIVANYANVDMVGHTGDIAAASIAIAVVDECVMRVVNEAVGREMAVIITADHGNAEQMVGMTRDQATETMHTVNPVPFILIARDLQGLGKPAPAGYNLLSDIMQSEHNLADVAPTILELYGIEKPADMTGSSLLTEIIQPPSPTVPPPQSETTEVT